MKIRCLLWINCLTWSVNRDKNKCLLLFNMKKQKTHFEKMFKVNAVKISVDCKNISEMAQELWYLLFEFR